MVRKHVRWSVIAWSGCRMCEMQRYPRQVAGCIVRFRAQQVWPPSPPPRNGGRAPNGLDFGEGRRASDSVSMRCQARVRSPRFGMPDRGVHNNRGRSRILIYHHHNELAVKTSRHHQQFLRHALFLWTNHHFCPSETHKSPRRCVVVIYLATGQREESLFHCILSVAVRGLLEMTN